MKFTQFITLLSLTLLCSCGKGDSPSIRILNKERSKLNSMMFGHFMEKASWGGEIGGDLVIDSLTLKPDSAVFAKLKALHIPSLRYPGGTDVDYYQWTDLIDIIPGIQEKRPPYRNRHSKEVVSDNRLGLNEFLVLCRDLGAEPLLVVNLGDAYYKTRSLTEAAEYAAALVSYCNDVRGTRKIMGTDWAEVRAINGHPDPFHVKWFEAGNEPWLFEGLKMKDAFPGNISHYLDCLDSVVNGMLSVDPGIKIITDGGIAEVNAVLKLRFGDRISHVAYHPYMPWQISEIRNRQDSLAEPRSLSHEEIWNTWVACPAIDGETGLSELVSDTYYQNVTTAGYPVAVTEWNWNGWFSGELSKATGFDSDLAKGIGAAGYLHAFMRNANIIEQAYQSMTVGQSWGITGIRVDKDGKLAPYTKPTGMVTGLYSAHHGDRMLETETRNIPYYSQPYKMNTFNPSEKVAVLDMVAGRDEKNLYIHIINRSIHSAMDLLVQTGDFQTTGNYTLYSMTGNADNSAVEYGKTECSEINVKEGKIRKNGTILKIPAASVNVMLIPIK